MAKKVVDKVLGFMGLNEEEEEIYEEVIEDSLDRDKKGYKSKAQQQANVLALHQQKQIKMVVMEPKSYDEVQAIADNLKNRRSVVVNLEHADKELAKRVVDFVSGTIYALNGSLQKVGSSIYLFVPSNVDITALLPNDENKDKGIFTWVR